MADRQDDCFEVGKVSFEKANVLQPLTRDYLFKTDELTKFFAFTPDFNGLSASIDARTKNKIDRARLVKALENQYQPVQVPEAVSKNIELLKKENTFTVTTGHQLSVFTGPLYFVFKILSTVKLTQQLSEKHPGRHFVPVFWMATEDHDFEEIASINLYGKKLTWENGQTGAVGHMKPDGLDKLLDELHEVLGNAPGTEELTGLLKSVYLESKNLAGATRKLVNHLFGELGVVVLDADDPGLKKSLIPVIKEDLFHHVPNQQAEQTTEQLKQAGYDSQVFPREINFFYLVEGLRERIEKQGDTYKVLNTDISFSPEELLGEVSAHPERFSPNVLLRPVYQELILPNVAYIGGGAEVAYWLQLKGVFKALGVFCPVVLLRDSALLVPPSSLKKMKKFSLTAEQLFEDKHGHIKKFIKEDSEINFNFSKQKGQLQQLFQEVQEIAQQVDPTLKKPVMGEMQKSMNALNNLEGKMVRAEKKNNEIAVNQIESIFDKAFPNGVFQERYENILPFYLKYGKSMFSCLLKEFDVTDKSVKVVYLS